MHIVNLLNFNYADPDSFKNVKIFWSDDHNRFMDSEYGLIESFDNSVLMGFWIRHNINDLIAWCKENCEDRYGWCGFNVWFFESHDDAILFTLKWT